MSESSKLHRATSNAGQSCRECRRRKGKCDGTMPVCSICQRYNRHCLYDKHSRSSLTRKHLTEVEERLEKVEALLRTLFSADEISQMLAHGVPSRTDIIPTYPGPPLTIRSSYDLNAGSEPSLHASLPTGETPYTGDSAPSPKDRGETSSSIEPERDSKPDFNLPEPRISSYPNVRDSTAPPLESLPSAADDFEWDEREASWSLADPRGGSLDFGSGAAPDILKITDGMATLTADDSNTGFLGSVSGAALLRLMWMSNATDATGDRSESRMERRKSLEQLFNHQSAEYSSPSPLLRTQPLITRAIADTLVDAYFSLYHPTFPILHEPSFMKQYSKLNSHPAGVNTWHILANLVAALGSFVSSTWSDNTHMTLFNAVKANLSIGLLETGSMNLVQAFALAANYLQKRNRPNSGYNYGGVALRMAISLGLHKELQGRHIAPFKKEIRRRVWWSLCVLDVGATVTYGRPLSWPQIGVDTSFPLNIHEKDLTITATSFPPELNETTLYTYIRTQSSYHLRTMRIYNRLISSPIPSAAELISLDDDLIEGWKNGLPEYFCDKDLPLSNEYLLSHSISRWRFRFLRIIMYRPFLISWVQNGSEGSASASSPSSFSDAERVAITRCFQAAEDCISVIFRFWSTGTHTRLAAWYVLYFLLQAALIPVHCLRRNPSHPDAGSWRSQVLTTLNIINAMDNLNPSAPKCRDIIHRLCGESLQTRSQSHSQFDSPMNQGPFSREQQQQQQDSGFPAPFSFSNPDLTDSGIDAWMTEIDTAIDGYDLYIDQLHSAAVAGMGRQGGENNAGAVGFGAGGGGHETGTGVQDWDWGLML